MPLYDCVLLLKPHVKQEALLDLVSRVGKHVIRRNGVLTEIKSVGTVQLGYGIRKLDGRFYQVNLPLVFDSAYFHLKTMILFVCQFSFTLVECQRIVFA